MTPQLNFIEWLSKHLLACPFKTHVGFDCPGCGFQRSIIALVQGDLASSIKLYPAAIPIIFVFAFTMLHLRMNFKLGAEIIKITYACIAIIILIHYIYKISTFQLYS